MGVFDEVGHTLHRVDCRPLHAQMRDKVLEAGNGPSNKVSTLYMHGKMCNDALHNSRISHVHKIEVLTAIPWF
jgi:hypothetical protein